MEQKSAIELVKDELIKRYESNGNNLNVVITTHACPDPDAIGSACGIKHIIKSFIPDANVQIVYFGEVSHPQNKTMIRVLNLQLVHIDEIEGGLREKEDIEKFAHAYICVDVVPDRSSVPKAEYLFVVDHHKSDTKNAQFKDIQQVGSASTLVWSYMRDLGIELDKSIEEDSNVATALVIGIKTDTSDLVTEAVTDLDFEAFKNLIEAMNQKYLAKIVNYPIPPYHFELRKRLDHDNHVITENGIFVGGIGYISPAKRDALPSIAEERARVEGIDTSFIVAIVGDNLEVSVRSSGLAIDVDKLCKKIFGKEYAGGKSGAGAARIPMGSFSVMDEDEETQREAWDFARRLWFKRILKEMSDHR